MPTWDIGVVRQALLKKGFVYARLTDHNYLRLCLEDGTVTSVRTKLSFGKNEDISHRSPLFNHFKRELHLTGAELGELFSCPLTREGYLSILLTKGVVKVAK